MNSKAYVLIKTEIHQSQEIYDTLRKLPSIKQVDIVTGPYDIIVTIESTSTDNLLDFLMRELRYIKGIETTITCIAISNK